MNRLRTVIITVTAGALLLAGAGWAVGTADASGRSSKPAVERHYPVVREAAADAPQYTVYRPVGPKGHLPVVVWGNGACNHASDVEPNDATTVRTSPLQGLPVYP